MASDDQLASEPFPRSSQYHPEWILAGMSGGANSLWLTEWLVEVMQLRAGMRVLDLGCGRGASSVFLHREFAVEVWAADLWFSSAERLERIRDAGVEGRVFPIHADARSLPFATGFFDAIVSIDSFVYYGTDDLYLNPETTDSGPCGPDGYASSVIEAVGFTSFSAGRDWLTTEMGTAFPDMALHPPGPAATPGPGSRSSPATPLARPSPISSTWRDRGPPTSSCARRPSMGAAWLRSCSVFPTPSCGAIPAARRTPSAGTWPRR